MEMDFVEVSSSQTSKSRSLSNGELVGFFVLFFFSYKRLLKKS